jgi:DNA-binding response OmpR family regulator
MTVFQPRRVTQVARFGEITLDFRKMELCRSEQLVALTLQEFKVLKFFVARPESVVLRKQLITAAWPKRKRSSNRTVDNYIVRLRQKIEKNPAHPDYLQTVYGVGYKFVPQENIRRLWQAETERVNDER